jgi:hypothetical protein
MEYNNLTETQQELFESFILSLDDYNYTLLIKYYNKYCDLVYNEKYNVHFCNLYNFLKDIFKIQISSNTFLTFNLLNETCIT